MRLQTITLVLCVIAFSITQQANAETFVLEATSEQDRNDYLYIELFWEGDTILAKNAFLKHDNYVLVFDGTPAKFYPSHGFSMKAPDLGIAIFGNAVNTLDDLEYYFTVITQGENGVKTLKFLSHGIPPKNQEPIVEEIPRDPMAEYEAAQILTGPALVSEQERLAKLTEEQKLEEEWNNRIVIPRSEYTISDNEIVVMTQAPFRVPWKSFYNFDIRVVDPVKNNLFDYYNTNGIIGDVSITGSIKDSLGNVLRSFSGNTTDIGHYSESAYIPENINTRDSFSLELNAIKYFDDTATFATYSILEEFFVFIPSDGSGQSLTCNEGYVIGQDYTCVPACSEGEILIPSDEEDGWMCVVECPEGKEFDDDWMCQVI